MNSFLFGRPGAPLWQRNLQANIFFRRKPLIRAALFVRQHGPVYLRTMSAASIIDLLNEFVTQNYGCISDEVFFQQFDVSLPSICPTKQRPF